MTATKIKILLIDDDDTVRSILTSFAHKYFAERHLQDDVTSMSDPVQGLFELTTAGQQYSLVLLDVRMPRLTGDEIYHSLMHVRPELVGRMVFVTGYAEDIRQRFAAQTPAILLKPFRYEDFTDTVNKILSQEP